MKSLAEKINSNTENLEFTVTKYIIKCRKKIHPNLRLDFLKMLSGISQSILDDEMYNPFLEDDNKDI